VFGADGVEINAEIKCHLHGLADEAFGAGEIKPGSHARRLQRGFETIEKDGNGRCRPEVKGLKFTQLARLAFGTDVENFRLLQKAAADRLDLVQQGPGPVAFKGKEVARTVDINLKPLVNRATLNSNDKHQPTAFRFFFSGSSKLMVWAMALAFRFLPRTSSFVPCLAQATSTRMIAMDFLVSLE